MLETYEKKSVVLLSLCLYDVYLWAQDEDLRFIEEKKDSRIFTLGQSIEI